MLSRGKKKKIAGNNHHEDALFSQTANINLHATKSLSLESMKYPISD